MVATVPPKMVSGMIRPLHGVSSHSLYAWLKQYGKPADQQIEESALQAEIRRLKTELRQVTEERNILKEAAAYFASESRKGTRS